MIQTLYIRNYVLIDKLKINFSNNLTTITGETGAGKSIILDALGLIMGNRADTKVFFDEKEKCVVEATFNIAAYQLQELFEQADIDYQEMTIIRREIQPIGKSRAFINDTPVTLQVLHTFSHRLIDLHQQFDTQDIQNNAFQVNAIDALADIKPLVKSYKKDFQKYDDSRRQLRKMEAAVAEAQRIAEFVTFQLKELKKAQLKGNELEALEQAQKQLSNAEEIQSSLAQATKALDGNNASISSQLTDLMRPLINILEYHPNLNPLFERLEAARSEVEDIAALLQEVAEVTEYDPNKLDTITSRINIINRLLKKYNVASESELVALQKDLQGKLSNSTNLTNGIAELEQNIARQELGLRATAKEISLLRRAACPNFEQNVKQMLSDLSMPYARLEVQILPDQPLNAFGSDSLEFMFCANKGTRMETLKQAASGGELSRLALCMKSLVADAIPLPTLIFDEIDSGVSGEVARQMSAILKQLATSHQVIVITHSPQIAAKGHTHYFVHKVVRGERSYTSARQLDFDERLTEISKMLSGNPPTEAARANALEMLNL
jgi:DNA repair protein RecN (Recombination protein N)